jgi:hypothetical protein
VYQHWDPLRTCVVGRSHPPEFYSWIEQSHVRSLFEKIAVETEEDYQKIIAVLQKFGVEILRPDLPEQSKIGGVYMPPPMTPRDLFVMIGDTFYHPDMTGSWERFYNNVRDPAWPDLMPFDQLPRHIQQECQQVHGWNASYSNGNDYRTACYEPVLAHLAAQQVPTRVAPRHWINGAMVSRIGRDLYFGTQEYTNNLQESQHAADKEFPTFRNHIINTGGHGDGTYCPVCPGLIISLYDVPTYKHTFPGWEVVYLPGQSWSKVSPFVKLKLQNHGKWWIPGFEHDQAVIDVVETWLSHWTGYVEETVFDVNMLIIDPKNVMVFNKNDQVFSALARYGITPHVVHFRHRYFWDGGIHCVTLDLDRAGTQQDYFPERG